MLCLCLSTNAELMELRKSVSGTQEIPHGFLELSPCCVIEVKGELQQLNPGRTRTGPDPSGLKVWVTPPGKEGQPAKALAEGAEGKVNTEWVVIQKGSYK